MFRRRSQPEDPLSGIDAGAVSERFAPAVRAALAARTRYRDVLAGVAAGSVHERLGELGARIDAGVLSVWETARRASDVERALDALDPDRVTAEYEAARRASGADPAPGSALAARFASVQRLLRTLDDTDAGLAELDARFGGAVAAAADVVAGADDLAGVDAVGSDLVDVVSDLDALRVALADPG